MKYMLLIYSAEDAWSEDERKACMLRSIAIGDELDQQGKFIASSPLYYVNTATCVRVRNGRRQITDGPFAETTEQLGGYFILELEDLDQAIQVAAQLPAAAKGAVEIRPLRTLPAALALPEVKSPKAHNQERPSVAYILLMYEEEGVWPPQEHAQALERSVQICHELHRKSQYLAAAPLQSAQTATCVRLKAGKPILHDGPFTETKEQLAGYFQIQVADLDEAIAIAAELPGSQRGTTEIRPLFPLPSMA
jgi:hypothetical protein